MKYLTTKRKMMILSQIYSKKNIYKSSNNEIWILFFLVTVVVVFVVAVVKVVYSLFSNS